MPDYQGFNNPMADLLTDYANFIPLPRSRLLTARFLSWARLDRRRAGRKGRQTIGASQSMYTFGGYGG